MAKKEVRTDYWVASMLRESEIEYDPQGSNVKEIDEALKTASKKGLAIQVIQNLLQL